MPLGAAALFALADAAAAATDTAAAPASREPRAAPLGSQPEGGGAATAPAAAAPPSSPGGPPPFSMPTLPQMSPGFSPPVTLLPRASSSPPLAAARALLDAASLDVAPFLSDPQWRPVVTAPQLRVYALEGGGAGVVSLKLELSELPCKASLASELLWGALCEGGEGVVFSCAHLARAGAGSWAFGGGAPRAPLEALGGLSAMVGLATAARGCGHLPAAAAAVSFSNALLEVVAPPLRFVLAARTLRAVPAPLLLPGSPAGPPHAEMWEGVARSVAAPGAAANEPLAYAGCEFGAATPARRRRRRLTPLHPPPPLISLGLSWDAAGGACLSLFIQVDAEVPLPVLSDPALAAAAFATWFRARAMAFRAHAEGAPSLAPSPLSLPFTASAHASGAPTPDTEADSFPTSPP